MTRIKRGVTSHKRHKKILKQAKGYRGKLKNIFKLAKVAVIKAGVHAYRDRRLKKRNYRRLWITRLNAALKAKGYNYSTFIHKQKDKKVELDRKILADIAAQDEATFDKIVNKVMA